MSEIEISEHERAAIVHELQQYFAAELDRELGRFEAEFLLEFISKNLGPYFYNRGLHDAQALFQEQVERFAEAIYAIELPPPKLGR